jgi:hypothetical protein
MTDTTIVTAIENKNHFQAYELLEKTLYRKAGIFLEEQKKIVAAKTWPARNLTESNEKEILKSSRRKALKKKLREAIEEGASKPGQGGKASGAGAGGAGGGAGAGSQGGSSRTEVRSPTSTSTKANTTGNITVTGGTGAGATTEVRVVIPGSTEKAEK